MRQKPFKLKYRFWLYSFSLIFISIVSTYLIFISLDGKLYVEYQASVLKKQSDALAEDFKEAINREQFEEQAEWYSEKAGFYVWVIDGLIDLTASDSEEEANDELLSDEKEQRLLGGESITTFGYLPKFRGNMILAISPLEKNSTIEGYIITGQKANKYKNSAGKAITSVCLVGIIISIFLIYTGVFLQKRVLTPLEEMEKGVKKMAEGTYSTIIPINGIDEIARLTKAFNQMSATISEEDERKTKFIADISHELRTPLSYVKGYTNALLDGLGTKPQETKKYLQIISQETNRLQMLVQDLLDLTKLESNILLLNKQPLVFSQCIIDVLDEYKILLCEKNLQLNVDLNPEIIIEGDEQRIKQIIENIFENALRYSKQDGQIDVLLEAKIGFCALNITDNGVGMSEEHLSKVKERFYRVNGARTRLDGGAGIGLTIAEQLIKLHGGNIKIQSKLNVGTKVIIEFPFEK